MLNESCLFLFLVALSLNEQKDGKVLRASDDKFLVASEKYY
jgi:hypothetical protein